MNEPEKKAPKKRKNKYARRKRWLRIIFGVAATILLSLAVAYMTRDKSVTIDSSDIDNSITSSSTAYKDSIVWNKNNGQLIAKIFIGNMKDIDDVTDDSNLSNLDYDASLATVSTGSMAGQTIKSSVHRVNNHYIVLVFDGVKKDFAAARINLTPVKIYKSVDTDVSNSGTFYVEESKVKIDNNAKEETTEVYKNSWQKYKIDWYKNKISKCNKKIDKYQKRISGNNDLIKKLQAEKAKKDKISSAAGDKIQNQIDELNQTNTQTRSLIADTQKDIKTYQAKINMTESGNF